MNFFSSRCGKTKISYLGKEYHLLAKASLNTEKTVQGELEKALKSYS